MIKSEQGCAVSVEFLPVAGIADGTEDVGNTGDLQGMLGEVFRPGAAHESPSLYVFHP